MRSPNDKQLYIQLFDCSIAQCFGWQSFALIQISIVSGNLVQKIDGNFSQHLFHQRFCSFMSHINELTIDLNKSRVSQICLPCLQFDSNYKQIFPKLIFDCIKFSPSPLIITNLLFASTPDLSKPDHSSNLITYR